MRQSTAVTDEEIAMMAIFFGGKGIEPRDATRLSLNDGLIHFKMRGQDGTFTFHTLPDNPQNRMLVQWIQIHD